MNVHPMGSWKIRLEHVSIFIVSYLVSFFKLELFNVGRLALEPKTKFSIEGIRLRILVALLLSLIIINRPISISLQQ